MASLPRLLGLLTLAFVLPAPSEAAADQVAGELIIFNDNGGWSWFQDERVIFDAARGRIVFSSVASAGGAGGASRGGDVDVVSYDLATGTTQRFTLSDNLQDDDHDSAALLRLPDGRYLASYSKHASDNHLRYRATVSPGDITDWEPERVFLTAAGTTYSNLYYLTKSNTVFNFHRDNGRGFDPNYLVWNLNNAAGFSYGGRLLTGPEGNSGRQDRPYLRYVGNGIDRIHFIATDHHPRNLISNSVYHGYIQYEGDGYGVHASDGTRLGELSTLPTSPFKASDFTPLLRGQERSPVNGLMMTRGWTTDIELDAAGNPYVAFTARVDDRDLDHRFFYGRFERGKWSVHELAKAGGHLYSRENDYTGLVALDPNDPDHLFISTYIDPRSGETLGHYEIFEGTTSDRGANWSWKPITFASSVDNLRPIVPKGPTPGAVLLWMRGKYNLYTDYNTQIVGLTTIVPIDPVVAASRPSQPKNLELNASPNETP